MSELADLRNVNYEITSIADVERINLILRRVIEIEKKICDRIDPEIANAYKTHKGLTALKKEELAPILRVKEQINVSLKAWQIKKEQEAKELRDRINKELAEKAEALRLEKLKEAEGKDEWSKELAVEEAESIKADSVDIVACKEAVIPKQEGQYKRSNWKARVVDYNLVPKIYWKIDEKLLDEVAKKEKGQFNIQGVEFYDDFTIVTKV